MLYSFLASVFFHEQFQACGRVWPQAAAKHVPASSSLPALPQQNGGENCKRKNNKSLQVSLINEREKRREQSLTNSPVPSSRPRPSHSPSNSYFRETYHSLLPNMMLHGMEYPSGQSGAALLAEPLPSLLLTPSLLTGVTEWEREGPELCNSWTTGVLSPLF